MLSVCDVYLLGENVNTIKKNTEAVLVASNKGGVQVTAKEAMCVFTYFQQN